MARSWILRLRLKAARRMTGMIFLKIYFIFKKSLRMHLIKISYFYPCFFTVDYCENFLLQCPTIQGVCET